MMASAMYDASMSSLPTSHESISKVSSTSSSVDHIFIEHNYACLLLSTTFGKRLDEPDHNYNVVEVKTEEVSSMIDAPPIVKTYTASPKSLQTPINTRNIKKEHDDNDKPSNQRSQRRRRRPKRWDDDEATSELASDKNNTSINKENEEQDDDESEDDPTKLWCICKQPHNNRHMIQCDTCDDWFHIKCVNITKAKLKALEKQNTKWFCPTCIDLRSQPVDGSQGEKNHTLVIKEEPVESFLEKPSEQIKSEPQSPLYSPDNAAPNIPHPMSSPKASQSTSSHPLSASSPKKSPKVNESRSDRKVLTKKFRNDKQLPIGDVLRQKKLKEAGSKAASIERKEANRLKKLIRSQKMGLKKKLDKSNKPENQQNTEADKHENKWEPISKVVPLARKTDEKKKKSKVTPVDPSFNDLFKAEPIMMTKKINPTSYASTATTPSGSTVKRPSISGQTHQRKSSSEQHCVSCDKLVPKGAIRGKELSIYCSETCLEKYIKNHIEVFKRTKAQSSAGKSGKVRIAVFERSSNRILSGDDSVPEDQIIEYIKSNPTFEVFYNSLIRRQSSTGSTDDLKKKDSKSTPCKTPTTKRKEEPTLQRQKSTELNSTKLESKKDDNTDAVRSNVKKTLKEVLETRCHEADNRMLSEDIVRIADKIELEMFNFFNKTIMGKYLHKYRSLLFNLKDPKNQGLFRKVLTGSITPERLVKMNPDELASPELAKWRERETKHAIEMIKRDAEAMSQQVIVKKTHKGEEVIEKKTVLGAVETATEEEFAKNPLKPAILSASVSATTTPTKEKTFSGLDLLPNDLLFKDDKRKELDTTDKHHQHLFDAHCKICNNEQKIDLPPPALKQKSHNTKSDDTKISQPKRVRVEFDVEPMTKIYEKTAKISRSDKVNEKTSHETSEDQSSKSLSPECTKKPKAKQRSSCWRGFIHFPDLAKFFSSAHEIYGLHENRLKDMPDSIFVCGRIAPEQAIDYLKMISSEDMAVVKFVYNTPEDRRGYDKFFQYLYERKRYGVVGKTGKSIKDFYILPLPKDTNPPDAILPPDGLNLESERDNLLLGVLVRNKKHISKTPIKEKVPTVHAKYEITNPVPRDPPERSFTPPPPESIPATDVTMSEPTIDPIIEPSVNKTTRDNSTASEAIMSQSYVNEPADMGVSMAEPSKDEEPTPYIPGLGLTPSPKEDEQNEDKPPDESEEPYDPEAYTPEYIPTTTSTTSSSYYSV